MSFDLGIDSSVYTGITRIRKYNNEPHVQGARQGQRQAPKPEPVQPGWLADIVRTDCELRDLEVTKLASLVEASSAHLFHRAPSV